MSQNKRVLLMAERMNVSAQNGLQPWQTLTITLSCARFEMSKSEAHIEITLKLDQASCEITSCYAVTPEQEHAWKQWLAGQATAPSDEAVDAWLDKNEAKLDRTDGPAVVMKFSDGSRIEEWWANGNLHRVGAPAFIETNANGSQRKQWYSNDKLDRTDGPAIIVRDANGTILFEEWYHNGILDNSKPSSSRGFGKPPSHPAP